MSVVIYSVQHSGTHFLKHFLERAPVLPVPIQTLHVEENIYPPNGATVIAPMRDPLAVLLAQYVRHWKTFGLASFEILKERVAAVFPVDVPKTLSEREAYLQSVADAVNISLPSGYCHQWADTWDIQARRANSYGQYALKTAYVAGDLVTIEKAIPTDLANLRDSEKRLRPWLEQLGYRNLMWWDG